MFSKFLITALTFCMSTISKSQVKIIVKAPENQSKNTDIFMASSLNGWNPADEKFKFKKEGTEYSLILAKFDTKIPVEYKYTAGGWDKAEVQINGQPKSNRVLPTDQPVIYDKIDAWAVPVVKQSTRSKNVKILSENFAIPQLKTTRRIWIYLPEDYAISAKRYPVMYVEDGQNLFDDATSFSGEWHIDETLDHLFSQNNNQECIVIGIDNGGAERLNEYSPWKNAKYGGGKGDLYAEFLADTLKPFVDKHYRTMPQANHTLLLGSSMGGLISLYTGVKYPAKFGKLAIFSPSIWFAKNNLQLFINKNSKLLRNTKFYFLAGTKESDDMVNDVESVKNILLKAKVPTKNIITKYDADGKHSESYWSREFENAYKWLINN